MSDEDGGADGSGVPPRDGGRQGSGPAPDSGAPEPADGAGDDGDEDEWRFSLEDLPSEDDEGNEGEGIAGAFGPSKEIEPGDIDRESVLFVVLGACIAVVGLYLMFP
jgi:hypothetical protein